MTSTTTSWWREDAPTWHADGWSFELRGDEIADIRRGGAVIIRAVRAVVRDHGWNTVPAAVIETDLSDESLTLRLRHVGLGASVTSTLTVDVTGDGLRIAWDAENLRDFSTCRTGLVLLHPASDAGRPVTVTHSDGSAELTAFPSRISPHQPIFDIRGLDIHQRDRGDDAVRLRFDGDVFEMEDQRNWSDASFKTYSRPLDLPYPYPLAAGERVRQSITIGAAHVPGPTTAASAPASEIGLAEGGPFPAVGVEASTAPDPAPETDRAQENDPATQAVPGAFRVIELNLTTPTWRAALTRAAADGLPLDVRLVVGTDSEPLAAAARTLAEHRIIAVTPVDSVLHVSDERVVARTRAALDAASVLVPLRGGTRSHFTELNRERAGLRDDLDGIAFTTTPLFHSLDTEQLVEALPVQRLIAEQSVEMAEGRPVHIGPVTLRPRFNNVATSPEPAPTRTDLREGYGAQFTGGDDERQGAGELAAWTIASAAALAVPGVASLSFFETWGPRGLRDSDGARRPVADAVDELVALGGRTLLWGPSPDGLVWAIGAGALGAGADDGVTVLVANLDRVPRSFVVRVPGGTPVDGSLAAGTWLRVAMER